MQDEPWWELVSEKADGTRKYRHRRTGTTLWTKRHGDTESVGYGPVTTMQLTAMRGEPAPDSAPKPAPEMAYWGDLPEAEPTEQGGRVMAETVKYEIRRGEFGWALEELKRGNRVQRESWRHDPEYEEPECLALVGMPTSAHGLLYAKVVMIGRLNEWCGWTASSEDMLATDWQHYEEGG